MPLEPTETPPSNDRDHVLLLGNPNAGRGSKRGTVNALVRRLGEIGLHAEVVESLDEFGSMVRSLAESDRLRCVVAAGGDGTVRAVINALPPDWTGRIPVAILPMGTENLVAKQFHIHSSGPVDMLSRAIQQCQTTRLDAGRVNGKLFLAMFSCGFDAEVIRRLHAERRGNISHLSYVWPIWRTLLAYSFPTMRVQGVDAAGKPLQFDSNWFFAFNLPRYARGLPIATNANPTDGAFQVRSFTGQSRLTALGHFLTVATHMHGNWSGCRSERCHELRVESSEPVPFQIDGDPGGMLPAMIELLPQHVCIVLPPNTN